MFIIYFAFINSKKKSCVDQLEKNIKFNNIDFGRKNRIEYNTNIDNKIIKTPKIIVNQHKNKNK